MVGGLNEGPSRDFASELFLARGRKLLVSAWVDYYSGYYSWSIIKAWLSASIALLRVDPLGVMPVSYRLLRIGCSGREVLVGSVFLDSIYRLASDPWLPLVLGDEWIGIGRRDALDCVEASIHVFESLEDCKFKVSHSSREDNIRSTGVPHAVSMGPVLVIIDESVGELSLAERLREFRDKLVAGFFNIILTPDEALSYFSTPLASYYASIGDVNVLADETGIARMVASASGFSSL